MTNMHYVYEFMVKLFNPNRWKFYMQFKCMNVKSRPTYFLSAAHQCEENYACIVQRNILLSELLCI